MAFVSTSRRWPRRAALVLAFAALACTASAAPADEIVMKSGSRFKGRIYEQSNATVSIEMGSGNLTVRKTFKMEEIASLTKDADAAPPATPGGAAGPGANATAMPSLIPAARPKGPIYFVIPLRGEVGIFMTRAMVQKALEHADKLNPDVVVMEINSPGGFVSEMMPIMDEIVRWETQHPDKRLVALVEEQAFSAAAIISMTIKEIYVTPSAPIGAAMIISADRTGAYSRVHEKVESALRGKVRSAAEFGGHNPLIVEAMIDPAVSLSVAQTADGKPVVLKGLPEDLAALKDKYKKIEELDDSRQLLTLSPQDAVKCGLAVAIVADEKELMAKLGLPGAQEFDGFAKAAQEENDQRVKRITKEFERLSTLIKRRQESRVLGGTYSAMASQKSELEGIKASMDRIEAKSAQHEFLKEFIEQTYGASFTSIRSAVDEQLKWVEEQMRQAQQRRSR